MNNINNLNFNSKTESDFILEIFSIIDNLDYVDLIYLLKQLLNKGLWKYYRMNRAIINKYIDNHNRLYLSLFYRT